MLTSLLDNRNILSIYHSSCMLKMRYAWQSAVWKLTIFIDGSYVKVLFPLPCTQICYLFMYFSMNDALIYVGCTNHSNGISNSYYIQTLLGWLILLFSLINCILLFHTHSPGSRFNAFFRRARWAYQPLKIHYMILSIKSWKSLKSIAHEEMQAYLYSSKLVINPVCPRSCTITLHNKQIKVFLCLEVGRTTFTPGNNLNNQTVSE